MTRHSILNNENLLNQRNVSHIMLEVSLALLIGIFILVIFFGWGVLIQMILCLVFAIVFEASVLKLRKKNIHYVLKDYSAMITALLIAISLPTLAPWWISAIGVFFAIVFAKHLYGGLGHNIFNPAMSAYVLLIIAFPQSMTQWPLPTALTQHSVSFLDCLHLIFTGTDTQMQNIQIYTKSFDAVTLATPLDTVKTQLTQGYTLQEIQTTLPFTSFLKNPWHWVNSGFLLGGLLLLYRKIITWHIPCALLGSLLIFSSLLFFYDPSRFSSPLFHLFTGATMLGAWFIATDPVTSPSVKKAQVIFGISLGFLILLIREFGGYPDAIAFSVLLMNLCVPLLDRFYRKKFLI